MSRPPLNPETRVVPCKQDSRYTQIPDTRPGDHASSPLQHGTVTR